jgi:hypothetical protein
MQNPIHPDGACASFLAGKPTAHGLDVIERPSPASAQVAAEGDQAGHRPAPKEEVRRDSQESFLRQPVGLVPQILAHPERIVDHDDAGPRTFARRPRQIDGHPS